MNETQAFVIARTHLIAALREYGYDCAVQAGRQPTKQLLRDNTVYLFAISEKPAPVLSCSPGRFQRAPYAHRADYSFYAERHGGFR